MTDDVRILLGPFSNEPFASGLYGLLRTAGDFRTISFIGSTEIAQIPQDDQPSILITEGDDPRAYRFLLEANEHVALVLLNPDGAQALLGLSNPGWSNLYQVIRAAAEMIGGSSAVEARIKLIDPISLAATAFARQRWDAGYQPLVDWLNLALARPLLAQAEDQADHGVPGWSVAPREALRLLDGEIDQLSREEIEARHFAAEQSLIVGRTGLPPAIGEVARRSTLSDDDLRLLCLVLAPEIDGRYGTAIGVLQDDLTRRRPSLTLLARVLGGLQPAWDLRWTLAQPGSVLSAGLIEAATDGHATTGADIGYSPTQALIDYLLSSAGEQPARTLGAELLDPRPVLLGASEEQVAGRLMQVLSGATPTPLLYLAPGSPDTWFPRIAAATGQPLLRADLAQADPGRPAIATLADWCTLCRLHDAGLFLVGLDALPPADRYRVERRVETEAGRLPFIALSVPFSDSRSRHPAVRIEAPTLTWHEQVSAWLTEADAAGLPLDLDGARKLSAMGPTTDADRRACVSLALAGAADPGGPVASLQRALGDLRRRSLPTLIRRIEPTYDWDDLILPPSTAEVLRTIPNHVIYAGQVLEDWSFARRVPYGQGVTALFTGPSGTGKTMAAQIIARSLGVDLFQIDLSKIVSKYIGETEKNLDQVFDIAETDGAVLLFDEADALFGKRTEVRDAHDRHANVEVAYLLQRMEAFSGLAVLTTNLRQNIDQAFLRRLRFLVEFPVPSASDREAIWERAFPADTPRAADLDLALLARRLPLTGGNIQQIALHAAFSAAAEGSVVSMRHAVEASRRELTKIGMLNAEKALDALAA